MLGSLPRLPNFSQSRLSLAEKIEIELALPSSPPPLPPLPPPPVSRFGDWSVERPVTAPNGAQQGRDRSKGPPVAFRAPVKVKHAHDENEGVQAGFQRASGPSRMTFAHQRATSMKVESTKAFVDLLDAQSEIRPADFRTRVQATGARDYGEDVADRNIAVNGVDLGSSQVQTFHAPTTQAATDTPVGTPSGRAGLRKVTQEHDGLYRQAAKQISVESGLQTKSLNSSHPSAFAKQRPSSPPPEPEPLPAGSTPANSSRVRAVRRQTLSTHRPASSAGSSNNPQAKTRPASLQRGSAAFPDPGLHISTRRANGQHTAAPGWDTTSPEPESGSPVMVKATHDSTLWARRKAPGYNGLAIVPPGQGPFKQKGQPVSLPRPSSSRDSVAGFAFASSTRRPSRSQSFTTLSGLSGHERPSDLTPLAHSRPPSRGRQAAVNVDGDDVAPSPC